jgi:hypothetical protein
MNGSYFTREETAIVLDWIRDLGMTPMKCTAREDSMVVTVKGGVYVNAYINSNEPPKSRRIEIEIGATLVKDTA